MSLIEEAKLLTGGRPITPRRTETFFPPLPQQHDNQAALAIVKRYQGECLTGDMYGENDSLGDEATAVLEWLDYLYDEYFNEWAFRSNDTEPWLDRAENEARGNKPNQVKQYSSLFILSYWVCKAARDSLDIGDEILEQQYLALARRIATHCTKLIRQEEKASFREGRKRLKQIAGGVKSGATRRGNAQPRAPKARPNNDTAILDKYHSLRKTMPSSPLRELKSIIAKSVINQQTGNCVTWQTVNTVLKKHGLC
jgi:hypothetical protein